MILQNQSSSFALFTHCICWEDQADIHACVERRAQ